MKPYSAYIIARSLFLSALALGLFAGTTASSPSNAQAAPMSAVAPGDVVISEFRLHGPNGGDDEYIEIYNPKSNSIDISLLEVWGSNKSGSTGTTPRYTFPANTTLLPGRYYLITNATSPNGYSGAVNGDGTYLTGITDDGGVAITLPGKGAIIDAVGLDTGSAYKEGNVLSPFKNKKQNQFYERLPGGLGGNCVDSNNNNADFVFYELPSVPQNSSSPAVICATVINVSSSKPDGTYTTGEPIPIEITFSEPVKVTGMPKLTLKMEATNRDAIYDSGSGTATLTFNYTIQAGDKSSDLDYVAIDSLSLNGGTITKTAGGGNAALILPSPGAPGSLGMNNNIAVATGPVLSSFKRQAPLANPTNANTLTFRATFSEDVTGVDTDGSDFKVTGAIGTTMVVTGSGSVYDIQVSGGDLENFNGIVGLDLSGSQNITDTDSNPLPAGEPPIDETYLVDNKAPSITSFVRKDPTAQITNANALTFRVTFSEEVNVATVDTSDFIVHDNAPDITTTALVTNVSKFSATEYDVTVSGGDLAPPASFNGVVGLDLNKAPPTPITDLAGNSLTTSGEPATDETYIVDHVAPKIKYFKRQNPLSNPTNADVLTFRVEFSEDVVNVDKNDFTVTTAPLITVVVSVSSVGGSAKIYDVAVSGSALKSFDGEVGLNLKAGQNIQDIVGNPLPTAEPDPPIVDNDQTYSVNNSMPYIISFKRQNPLDSPTSTDTLVFRVMFSKDVVNVDTNDFSVNINIIEPVPAAPPTVTKVEPYGASKTIYDVTISGGDLNFLIGEVGLDLSAGQDIKDATTPSNSLLPIEPTIDETYKVINGHPFIKSITRKNPTSSPTDADTLVFRVTFSEVVVGSTVHVGDFDVNIDPSPVGPITVKGITPTGNSSYYDITVSGAGLVEYNGVVGLDLNISPDIVDTNGNVLYPEDPIPAFDQVYEVDNNNLLVKIEQDASQSDPTEVLPIKFTVSFSKPINTATFTTADIKQNGTARGITWNIANPSGDKKNFNLTVTKVTVKGTLIPSITAGSVQSAEMPILDNLASISLDNSVTYAIIPTPVRKPTAVPVGRPIINEFLPRPGFDWNHDGRIDVFDEFIEIKNVGPVEINLKGWKLDDEEGIGSSPFVLPDITLKPGERIVFYGLQTNILLGDGGDSVRLLNPSGKVWDAYTYPIAKKEDQSWCRFPDGLDWYDDCVPTPGLFNAREGTIPTTPQGNGLQEPVCNLPDTLPNDFLMAECNGYGANIWRSRYWDKPGLQGDQNVPGPTIKFETFVE